MPTIDDLNNAMALQRLGSREIGRKLVDEEFTPFDAAQRIQKLMQMSPIVTSELAEYLAHYQEKDKERPASIIIAPVSIDDRRTLEVKMGLTLAQVANADVILVLFDDGSATVYKNRFGGETCLDSIEAAKFISDQGKRLYG